MKIVDRIEKIFQVRKFKKRINVNQQMVPKLLEGVVPYILQYVHETASSVVEDAKPPFQHHQFVGKTENKKCTKWLLKPDLVDQETCLEV